MSGPKQRVELTGANGGAVKVESANLPMLELARRIAFIFQAAEVATRGQD
jgi:hypothetical protein